MKRNTKSALIIVGGLTVTLLVMCPGTMFVFMIGGQIVRTYMFGPQLGPGDSEMFFDGMLSMLAMPFVLAIGAGITLWIERCTRGEAPRRPGYCDQCGYDLRGSGLGASCPECGYPDKIDKHLQKRVDRDRSTVVQVLVWGFVYLLVVWVFWRPLNGLLGFFFLFSIPAGWVLCVPPALGVFWLLRIYRVQRNAEFKYIIRLAPVYLPLIFICASSVGHSNTYSPLPYIESVGPVLFSSLLFALPAGICLGLILYVLEVTGVAKRGKLCQVAVVIVLAVLAAQAGFLHGQGF